MPGKRKFLFPVMENPGTVKVLWVLFRSNPPPGYAGGLFLPEA